MSSAILSLLSVQARADCTLAFFHWHLALASLANVCQAVRMRSLKVLGTMQHSGAAQSDAISLYVYSLVWVQTLLFVEPRGATRITHRLVDVGATYAY